MQLDYGVLQLYSPLMFVPASTWLHVGVAPHRTWSPLNVTVTCVVSTVMVLVLSQVTVPVSE